MAKIVVIASINMDVSAKVKSHPKPGETVKSDTFTYTTGGKGTNQAIAASRLGGSVCMVGKVGSDTFGKESKDFLVRENLDTTYISVAEGVPTGAAFVAVDDNAENIIYISSGANNSLMPHDVARVTFESGDIVMATLETPIGTTEAVFSNAKKVGAKTILNAAPAVLDAKKLFEMSDYLIVNETELASFAESGNIQDPEDAVAAIKKMQLKDTVVIATLGKQGAVALVGNDIFSVDGQKVHAVDTTAAGDCFLGAFAVALQEGKTLQGSLFFANAAAAVSVQRLGGSSSMPWRKDVE